MAVTIHELFPTPVVIDDNIVMIPEESEILSRYISSEDNFRLNGTPENGNYVSKETYILSKTPKLKREITKALKLFADNIMFQDNLTITQSWLNKNPPGSMHHRHNHSNSIVSGVYYFSTDENTGNLNFFKSDDRMFPLVSNMKGEQAGKHTTSRWYFTPRVGSLFLFPSNLAHSVNINTSTITRVSLSFNTFYSSSFGSEKDLTYVNMDRIRGNA